MTDFSGIAAPTALKLPIPGSVRAAYTWRPQMTGLNAKINDPLALATPALAGTRSATGTPPVVPNTSWLGNQADKATPAFDFFEKFHVIPRAFAFGNILSTQVASIEVYNAFRRASHYWTAFVNNAGAGVSLSGMPSLPALVPFQHGDVMTLQVATNGPPRVISTLDFSFDTGVTIYVPITLQRVVLFSVFADTGGGQTGYEEELEFLTDVIPHVDQTEQRIRLRKCPRQAFIWDVFLEDGRERDIMENILFDWQSQVFGVGVAHELTHSTGITTVGATTINVLSTADADYRVGGLFIVYQDQFTFDVLQVASLTGTSITATTATLNGYTAGALVMPLRTAFAPGQIGGSRWRVNGSVLNIRFQVNDNDVSIASTAGWNTFNSKVLLDDANVVQGQLRESYEREMRILDSDAGLVDQQSSSDRHRRVSMKTFWTNTQAGLWRVRKLLHSLGGRQTSFYLPTFYTDLEVQVDLANGSNQMVVKNVGYSQFVRNRSPRNVIRILKTDGTTLLRTITASTPTSATVETLTVDSPWPSLITVASIDRISFVEKVRADSDTIRIQHAGGETTKRISMPVRTVLE